MAHYQFPQGFLWGAATAAFQVEGYPRADGAGISNWDAFCHRPGTIANDHTGDVGPGQYRKYREDVQLMKRLGIKAYRLSLSWSRIFPEGTGRVNEAGLRYYQNLVDELLANGIQPWVTLFHWDLPQALEDRWGGWRSKDTARAFGDYAGFVAGQLSDRVTHFFTVNEICCFTVAGYGDGVFAPGLKLDRKTVNQTVHNACLAHGCAVQAVRANARQPVRIGIVENSPPCVPVIETPEHIDAARRAYRALEANRLTLMYEGRYPEEWLKEAGANAPEYTDEELKIIAAPTDFLGLNLYAPEHVMADPGNPAGFKVVPHQEGYPRMNMPWLFLGPEIIYWATRFCRELWNVPAVYITENGCAAVDKRQHDGEIYDTERVLYLRQHLQAAHRAVSEGLPLHGYFVWSLMDNFEWACGYDKRFGIVYVDFQTLERIPKLSAKFYQEVIRQNAVV